MGKQIAAALSAHISEHMAHKYRAEAQAMMGQQLPPLEKDGKGMTPEQESMIAAEAPQAAAQLTGKAQQQAVLEQQTAAAQDWPCSSSKRNFRLSKQKNPAKGTRGPMDAQVDMQKAQMRQSLEERRLAQQKEIAAAKIQADLLKSRN